MGNCKSTSKKYSKSPKNGTELIIRPVPTKFTLAQTQLIYEAVLNAYIRKQSIPEFGVVFLTRGGKSHISLTIQPSPLSDNMAATEIDAICKILGDYYISIGVGHEIYINECECEYPPDSGTYSNSACPNTYKLYCHVEVFG